jgi:L-asparaginase / beta-aspartyl-peptidase
MSSTILVHGGAGPVTPDRHDRVRAGVRAAAAVGHAILDAGGSALDAVVAAVRVLEDDPEFNAGTGSALTLDGTVETDASVMDGATQRAGAVAAVPDLGNAIALARAVLEAGEHVILAGPAAWRFASEVGIAPAPVGSLVTARARQRLGEALARRTARAEGTDGLEPGQRGGTVGAVARDRAGRFAAATSTGGTPGKRAGRIGDSPIPGAGTWADGGCAISATGDGEAIVRVALAHEIASRVGRGGELGEAVRGALLHLRAVTGGAAGAIAIDRRGRIALQLTPAMPVAWLGTDGAGDTLGTAL